MDDLFLAAALVILLATGIALYRVVTGPVVVDRLLGLNVVGTKTIAVILLTGFLFDRVEFFIDIAPDALDRPDIRDPAWSMTLPLAAVAGLSVVLGVYPRIVMDLFHAVLGGMGTP